MPANREIIAWWEAINQPDSLPATTPRLTDSQWPIHSFPSNSLVLYRTRPARVAGIAGDKLSLGNRRRRDGAGAPEGRYAAASRPAAIAGRARLQTASAGDVATAWDLLAGNPTTVAEIAELAFGTFTPATAWAAWQMVAEGVYFRQAGGQIRAASERGGRAGPGCNGLRRRPNEPRGRRSWAAPRPARSSTDDRRYLREVEDLAYGRTERSRVLKALGREESPENAHAALLDWGAWDDASRSAPGACRPRAPAARRARCRWILPTLLADATRVDLTHLVAYAVDDQCDRDA